MTLPLEFVENMKSLLGEQRYQAFEKAILQEQPVSVRLNTRKCLHHGLEHALGCESVAWSENAAYLPERPSFTFDPMFHAGAYYVQEASSMFLGHVLRQLVSTPVTVLDLCAAPGGKSTDTIDSLPEGSLLVSNEIIRSRANILAENMAKWGNPNCMVSNSAPKDFSQLGNLFDVIIVDAPCSGEGMFRKDPNAITEWSPANVQLCTQRQREILGDVWSCLKPGGLLIYSTCTFNTSEDEENVEWIAAELEADPIDINIEDSWGITRNLHQGSSAPVYRFIPDRAKGEGFFLAALRKGEDHAAAGGFKTKSKQGKKSKGKVKCPDEVKRWIKNSNDYTFDVVGDTIFACRNEYAGIVSALSDRLNLIAPGLAVGQMKGKDVIPSQQLAMSMALDESQFPSFEADYATAIAYLRKEAINIPEGMPKGYVIVKFCGLPLGFVKNIGSRSNNLYPAEWKIRSPHIPEKYMQILKKRSS